jgi:hypothetical protein
VPTLASLASPLLPKAVSVAPVDNAHGMRTHSKSGFWLPGTKLNLQATALSPLPKTYWSALTDPNWRDTMIEEFTTLQANNTWDLEPRPSDGNIVTGKWGFQHKFHTNGSLDWYKARWVLRAFTQHTSIDFGETFSPVVKLAAIWTVLSVALSHAWPIHQLDVKNAFHHGTLSETMYCMQPSVFVDSAIQIISVVSTGPYIV